jgi:hypothetical protein
MTAATLKSQAVLTRPVPSHSAIRARRFLRAIVKALQASRREQAARQLEDLAALHRSSNDSYARELRAAARRLREFE